MIISLVVIGAILSELDKQKAQKETPAIAQEFNLNNIEVKVELVE